VGLQFYNLRVCGLYTYTGREWDKETGLYYYRARYYDPMEGRFISKDPISFAGGDVNLYGYTLNNPINLTDPEGLFALTVPAAVCAAVVGGVIVYKACQNPPKVPICKNDEPDHCATLRDNIINYTCKSIKSPAVRSDCYAAAWATYFVCLSQK
jgi:RHS repeat-associated protein